MEAIKSDWKLQELYNEYLSLKEEIREQTCRLDVFKEERFEISDETQFIMETHLKNRVKRFRIVVKDLELHGISPTDLLLLSVGVEVK